MTPSIRSSRHWPHGLKPPQATGHVSNREHLSLGLLMAFCGATPTRHQIRMPSTLQEALSSGPRQNEGFLEGITLWLERLHGDSTKNKGDFMVISWDLS